LRGAPVKRSQPTSTGIGVIRIMAMAGRLLSGGCASPTGHCRENICSITSPP